LPLAELNSSIDSQTLRTSLSSCCSSCTACAQRRQQQQGTE
jgi:hypothetical protein